MAAKQKLGCLALIIAVLVVAIEGAAFYYIAGWFGLAGRPDWFAAALGMVTLSIVGFVLVKWRAKALPQALMSGELGPAAAGVLGGILMLIPGFVTGFCGALLQLPPVQKVFGKTAATVIQVLIRNAMSRMGGGGFPGGFPGAGGKGGFPGGSFGGFPALAAKADSLVFPELGHEAR